MLVTFEMVHGNDDIGIGDSGTYFRGLAILPVDLDFPVVRTFHAIGDDNVATGGHGIEPVLHGALKMIDSVGAAARV